MLTFERTHDYELVRRVMTHPRIYPYLVDDHCPPASEFEPPQHPSIWYVVARDGQELLGLFMFLPENAVCWQVHTCLLPSAWGDRAAQASREVLRWVWSNTDCQRVVTNVPVHNRLALRFAVQAGLKEYGRNEKSFLRNNILRDQILLGQSRPEV